MPTLFLKSEAFTITTVLYDTLPRGHVNLSDVY